ncbi:Crp/Fnr family transcriptional regulator [Pseudomonas sp. MWU13-2100]|uniref:Crp/Fnr family transcriptional regulator n=1 Tax=Pseudomonas sp. MWU13-2100 TaxID=2935075 RepID=UPI00200F3E9F|nr:Crp/Fnr family transcriptional regulator [Pseudomonas sp. MWU13-2100]
MDVSAWRSRLLTGHWFNHLPAHLQDSLLATAKGRRLTPGQRLFQRGDPPCGLYAVLEGSIRVGAVSEKGKEALLGVIELPYWFGEISLFDGLPRTHDAYAVGHTILLQVPQDILLKLLDERPEYWRQFALLMSQKLRLTFIGLEQLSLMPAPARLAHRLLLIAEGYGELNCSRQLLEVSQEQLAAMLSLSRQTTNQILQDFQQQGILRTNYGGIEILDLERLRAMASA